MCSAPFSAEFWTAYLLGAASNVLDGQAARRLNQKSSFGAKLDSAADIAFIFAALAAMYRAEMLPAWSLCAAAAAIRLASYTAGFLKFHTFFSVHTLLNKAAGILLIGFPVLSAAFGRDLTAAAASAAALASAAEELTLILALKEPKCDTRSIFSLFKAS